MQNLCLNLYQGAYRSQRVKYKLAFSRQNIFMIIPKQVDILHTLKILNSNRFIPKSVLESRSFEKFTGKHLCQSLFFKTVAGKFLRTPFS